MTKNGALQSRDRYAATVLGALCACLLIPAGLQAQERVLPPHPSASQIIEGFDRITRDGGNAGRNIVRRFLERESGQSELDRLADGLVRLAIEGSTVMVRREALGSLFIWAKREVGPNPARVVNVLERVYDSVPDPGRKATIVHRMPELGPAGGVIAFLRRVAVAEETPSDLIPTSAIEGLAKLGEPGRAALRSLHASKSVAVPRARLRLEDLARDDFRIGGGGP